MTQLETLIQTLCPNGVKFVKLGEVGEFYGGLSGKTKEDFKDGNAKFITYKNIYSNLSLDIDVEDKVFVAEGEKQNTVQYGDVLFTGSSETPDECGMSSVLTTPTDEKLYLNSFCFGWRLFDKSIYLPDFLKHLFRCSSIRKEIGKTASGVTRFNVSKKKMQELQIPLPPLAVQSEIVRILDKFTLYKSELAAELAARLQQYEYYRDQLLTFDDTVKRVKLGEVGEFIRGNGLQKKDFVDEGFPCIHYGQIHTYYGTFTTKTKSFVANPLYSKLKKAHTGDLIIATTSEDAEGVCKAVAWLGKEDVAVSGDAYIFRHSQNPKYMAYLFQTEQFLKYKKKAATGTKVVRVSGESMAKFEFPIPSLEVQERIVSILDRFDKLCHDIREGLPAEIDLRQKQYEHYRDKLLTFEAEG